MCNLIITINYAKHKTWICSHNSWFPANGAGYANLAGYAKVSEPQSGDILVEKDKKKDKAPEERHINYL